MVDPTTATREEVTAATVQWRQLREDRLAAEKVAAKIKEQESELKQFLISAMLAQSYEGIVSDSRITRVSIKQLAIVEDRKAFEHFVLDTGNLHLLQLRLSAPAVKEMEESGVAIPGVGHMDTFDLSDCKA